MSKHCPNTYYIAFTNDAQTVKIYYIVHIDTMYISGGFMTEKQLRALDELNIKVKRVIFRSEREGFYITSCRVPDYEDNITVTMYATSAERDDTFTVVGEWVENSKYGWQFKAKTAVPNKSYSLQGLEKYLVDNIKGIGKKKARKLIDTFGHDTEDILNNEPEKVKECLGISDKILYKLLLSWNEANKESKYLVELSKLNITGKTAVSVYKVYGEECISVIQKNPYQLIDDVKRIGFKKADSIAEDMGIQKNDIRRVDAGLVYVLKQNTEFGNVCSLREPFISETAETLGVDTDLVNRECDVMIEAEKLIREGDYLYLRQFYFEEKDVAEMLKCLNERSKYIRHISDEITAKTGIDYTEEQKSAIDMSINARFMILTGGPGTGKTTVVKGIIKALEQEKFEVLCAAPTGRAAKRMQEATGHEASTIHRLLEFSGDGFQRNKENPLGESTGKYALIVDESSMIDISLMYCLLSAIPHNMSLILVGDVDQLPSVGPGTILKDIISSGVFPVIRLTKIQRQAEGSDIIRTAHAINAGKIPTLSKVPNDVYGFNITGAEADVQLDQMIKLYKNALTKYSVMDVQILSPQHTGKLGTDNLNNTIRDLVNKDGEKVPAVIGDFRVGDKVMQIKNNYKLGVFNGDIGYIEEYDDEMKSIIVNFGSFNVMYDDIAADDLVLAYACTIHKSQGSEYPVVILPVSTQHFFMLERNLIYTAVTRAKEFLFLLVDFKAMGMGVHKVNIKQRTSRLENRLKEA